MISNLINLSKDIEIQFKNKEAEMWWKNWEHNHSKTKLLRLVTVWLKCMQYLMKDEQELTKEIIKEAFNCAFHGNEDCYGGISIARDVIYRCWKYGDDFEILHRLKIE